MHVLSLPPAFVLSQDQTLRFDKSCPDHVVTVSKHLTRVINPNQNHPARISPNQALKIQVLLKHPKPPEGVQNAEPYTLIPKRVQLVSNLSEIYPNHQGSGPSSPERLTAAHVSLSSHLCNCQRTRHRRGDVWRPASNCYRPVETANLASLSNYSSSRGANSNRTGQVCRCSSVPTRLVGPGAAPSRCPLYRPGPSFLSTTFSQNRRRKSERPAP